MDTWKVFCAKHNARKQEILVKQKQDRLALLEKHKAELEELDRAHKETLEELRVVFEKDRVQRKQLKSKKSSVLKKRSYKLEFLASSVINESDDESNCTQKLDVPQSRQGSITKFLKKRLSREKESVKLIKKKAEIPSSQIPSSQLPSSQLPSTQPFDEIQTKGECVQSIFLGSDDDEEICRILSKSEKLNNET